MKILIALMLIALVTGANLAAPWGREACADDPARSGVTSWPTVSFPNRPRDVPVRLPPVTYDQPVRQVAAAAQGTYREEGQFLVLNLDGQEIRLARENASAPLNDTGGSDGQSTDGGPTGAVQGQLMHRGKPIAHCRIALIPLARGIGGYQLLRSGTREVVVTDERGNYFFPSVPPGPYKLTWLPDGETQWIRRAALRPDLTVREGQVTHVRPTRNALATIN